VRYRILGPLEARTVVDDPALRRRKPRALLAVLLLHANEAVSTDALLDALWPDVAPRRALGSLQNFVSQLRKALGEGQLETRQPGYVLRVEPDDLDARVFERLVAAAREGPAAQRRERLESALALWRGPPLAEFTYEPFAQAEIARLEELRLTALEQRAEADLELGRHAEVVGELESLVAEHPLREHLRALLMLALYRSGRQAGALEVYRDGRALLREELGLEPGAELRRVERSILAQAEDAGGPAAAAAPPSEPAPSVRKVVTVVFADVTGSTRLASSLDPETLRAVLARFFAAMRAVVEEHGGTVEKISGDEVMAVFGVPKVHENDGIRALRTAAGMHAALERLNELLAREHGLRLELRLGVNTGEVVTGDERDTPLVTGEAVNVGKRLQEAAAPGEVLVGPLTRAVVLAAAELEPVGPVTLRGRPEPLPAYRLVRLLETGAADGRDHAGTLVGRRDELARLHGAYERARSERGCRVAIVLGDAGIGKTRLARELTAGVDGAAQVLVGRCVSYGEGATYLPLVEVVRHASRETTLEAVLEGEPDAEQVARSLRALVGDLDAPLPAGEASLAVRRMLETLARRSPVVLVLEDLHWAEPTLLDLVEQLVARSADAPLLVLAVARPELAERRPHWLDDAPDRVVVRLEPLGDEEAEELVTALAGEAVTAAVRARVIEIAEGNPLFAEQLLRLAREGGPEALESRPPTVEALLASRLDALPPLERSTVERAAVIGRDFRRSELVALLAPERAALVEQALASLTRAGFVRSRRATASAEDAYAFHHVLIRDVAYGAVPKARRAELHEQLADWLVEHGKAPDEIVGYHLEQASRNLVELGSSVRRSTKLAADGGVVLGRAGIRALARSDSHAANNLLSRASSLLSIGDPLRLELLAELGVAQRMGGDLGRAEQVLADAVEEAVAAGDRRFELRARVELAAVRLAADPGGAAEELLQLTTSAVPVFEALRDDRALGRVWFLTAFLQGAFYCRNAAWEEASERAVTHYRRAGWSTASCLQGLAAALFYGPRPAAEGLARCDELVAREVTDRAGEAHVDVWRGALLALRGDFDEARGSVARAREAYEELGHPTTVAAACDFVRGFTEMLAGDAEAAESVLRASAETLEERGEWAHLATRAAEVADAIHAQGRHREAVEWTDVARRHSTADDVSAEFTWRSVRAKAVAAIGGLDEAEELGRAALALVDTTDALNQRADVRLNLSETLRLVGHSGEAAALAEDAAALYESKGNEVGARRARGVVQELTVAR
jgi:class 3 adenylate cyclase